MEACGPRIYIHLLHVVEDVNADAFQLQCEIGRNLRCPSAFVVVSPDCIDRRNGAQLFENLGSSDVACMDDVLDARKRTDCLRAQQSVRIGDEADRFQWPAQ